MTDVSDVISFFKRTRIKRNYGKKLEETRNEPIMQLSQTSYNNKSVLTTGIPICLKSLHCFTTLFKNQL